MEELFSGELRNDYYVIYQEKLVKTYEKNKFIEKNRNLLKSVQIYSGTIQSSVKKVKEFPITADSTTIMFKEKIKNEVPEIFK